MDNVAKLHTRRVTEPALAPLAPGRDVLLTLATAWSSSHGTSGTFPAVVAPPAAPRTCEAAARLVTVSAGRASR